MDSISNLLALSDGLREHGLPVASFTEQQWTEEVELARASWQENEGRAHRRLRMPADQLARLQAALPGFLKAENYYGYLPPTPIRTLPASVLLDDRVHPTLRELIRLWFASLTDAAVDRSGEFETFTASVGSEWLAWIDPNDAGLLGEDGAAQPSTSLDWSTLRALSSLPRDLSFSQRLALLVGAWSGSLLQPRLPGEWERVHKWMNASEITISDLDDAAAARAWSMSTHSPLYATHERDAVKGFLAWAYARASRWDGFASIDPKIHERNFHDWPSAQDLPEEPFPQEVKLAIAARRLTPAAVRPINVQTQVSTDALFAELDALVGIDEVKHQIGAIAQLVAHEKRREDEGLPFSMPSLNMVFTGNPGTGKTTVARLYGRILNQIGVLPGSAFVEVGRSDLVSEFKGATAVKTRDVIRRAEGGVLFIDEAYSLVPLGVGNASDYGYEAIAELVLAAENMRDRLVIVVAGYPMEMGRFMESNPGLQSRFRPAVVFPDMSGPALLEALERLAKRAGYRFTESARKGLSAYISEIPRGANFGNVRDMRKLLDCMREAVALRVAQGRGAADLDLITEDDVPRRRGGTVDEVAFSEALAGLNSLIGLEPAKQRIVEVAAQARFAAMAQGAGRDVPPFAPGHMVFSGSPGTGKTTAAKRVGQLLAALGTLQSGHVVEASRADLIGSFLGQTAPKVRDKVKQALDGVLFIDEAYALFSDERDFYGSEAIATLLVEMENHRERLVVVFAGYTDEMEMFLQSNPGLRSRVAHVIDFPDFGLDELTLIAAEMLAISRRTVEGSVARRVGEVAYASRSQRDFANARTVRTLVDSTLARHSLRVMTAGTQPDANAPVLATDVPDSKAQHANFGFA